MAKVEDLQETLLHFYSSELSAHAATIVGLSVLFFTCAGLFAREGFLPKIQLSLAVYLSKVSFDYVVVWLTLWLLASGIFYSLMRLMYYGALAHQVIALKGFTPNDLESLKNRCAGNVKGRIGWFSCGLDYKSSGLWFSLFVGFLVNFVVFILLFVE
jgi:hypothetical protein